MASEVFNNDLSKVNELFFTSRKTVCDQKVTNGQATTKTIQSSPLPKDESSSDDEEEETHHHNNTDDKENQDQDVVPHIVESEQVEA